MKYKYQLTPIARKVAVWQIEQYPEEKNLLESLQHDFITLPVQSFDGVHGLNKSLTRPTETTALKMISAPYLQRMEKGVYACERILSRIDSRDLELIDAVFWKKAKNMTGAAMDAYIARTSAYRRINDVLCMIAYEMGFLKGG